MATGLPQGTGGHIGPLPNVPAALTATLGIVAVEIDIDVWSTTNEIQPASSNLITVGIKTTRVGAGDPFDFDATQIDPGSLKFGPNDASNQTQPFLQDFDGDSDIDAVFGFTMLETGIACGDTEAYLLGETYTGESFTGTDSIQTSDCESTGCHP